MEITPEIARQLFYVALIGGLIGGAAFFLLMAFVCFCIKSATGRTREDIK